MRWVTLALLLLILVPTAYQPSHAIDLVPPPTNNQDNNNDQDDNDGGDDNNDDDCDANKGDPIDLYTGAERYKIDDLTIKGLYPLTLTRRTDSCH